MIPEYLKRNLELFQTGEYTVVSDKEKVILITEGEKEGLASLESRFEDEAVVFHFPEKRTLPYLDKEKKACQCADKFIFIKNAGDEKWQLHILEFKKSIKHDKWKKIKNQFKYGIMNARALAAFLNMEIDGIVLETAYRNDWNLRNQPHSPTIMRGLNSSAEVKAYREWQENVVILEVDSEEKCFRHDKVLLDSEGKGKKRFCTVMDEIGEFNLWKRKSIITS